MSQSSGSLAILIATKDRINELRKLLESISRSTLLPNKIVIVYSGEDISFLGPEFQSKLNIEIIYSPVASQSFQKSLGIRSLKGDYSWTLFMDDDLVVEKNSLEVLFSEYLNNPKYQSYVGFGLKVLNISARNLNLVEKIFLKLFKLYSDKPGTITKSGHVQSYLLNTTDVEVSWLNGLSVWNSKVLYEYPSEQTPIPYSAYEDVIFSYRVSRHSKLLFAPKVKMQTQKFEVTDILTTQRFIYGGYIRYQFVSSYNEFSKWWLLISQSIRNLDFIVRSTHELNVFRRVIVSTKLWMMLLLFTLRGVNGTKIWKYINHKS